MEEPQVLPDLEGLKQFYFEANNTNNANWEEIVVTWKEGTFEFRFDPTRHYTRCRQTCHQIKYQAFAKVRDRRSKKEDAWIEKEIPHREFCKVQHQCKGIAHCKCADYHQTEVTAERKRKREQEEEKEQEEKDREKKRRKQDKEDLRKKDIEERAKQATAKQRNAVQSSSYSGFLKATGIVDNVSGKRALNYGLQAANLYSKIGSDAVFDWNGMTESEKHGARLAAQILGLTAPVYNTHMPTIDDYENELQHIKKLIAEWTKQLQNLHFRSAELMHKVDSLHMIKAKEELLNTKQLKRSKSCSGELTFVGRGHVNKQ